MGSKPWAGREGGLPSTEALDPRAPGAARHFLGLVALCKGLLQAFMSPVAPTGVSVGDPRLTLGFPKRCSVEALVVKEEWQGVS